MFAKCPRVNVWKKAKQRIPILTWLPRYRLMDVVSDLVAGITVGLTLMPQAIAYAALAGLGPQYGLYSSFAGSFVYIFFGTVKEVNIGPTAIISLLTYNYTHDTSPDLAVLLCFISGLVELLCGILQLGFIVEFVSVPVTAGFSSAAAVIIASSQVKGLLGISIKSESFVETWSEIVHHIKDTKPWDLALSVACCLVLLSMRKLKDVKIHPKNPTKCESAVNHMFWLLSVSRNALVVVACAGLAYYLTARSETPFLLTGKIQPGLPEVSIPPFSTTIGNQTYGFIEMCSHLGGGMIVVPLISLLGNIAIAKAFANGEIVDATQEMITLGLCNIIGSFFSSIPVSGSFSRSAVGNASGIRTPLAGLYTGGLVLLALSLLTPYFYYIPKATLASVIVCAVLFMVEVQLVRLMWSSNRKDLVPAFATFLACLWQGVEMGILIGLVLDLLYLLYVTARPKCRITKVSGQGQQHQDYILVSPISGLLFPTIDYVRTRINSAAKKNNLLIVFDCVHISRIDFTGIQGLRALISDMKKKDRRIIFHRLDPKISYMMMANLGPDFVQTATESSLAQTIKCLVTDFDERGSDQDAKLEMQEMCERISSLPESQSR